MDEIELLSGMSPPPPGYLYVGPGPLNMIKEYSDPLSHTHDGLGGEIAIYLRGYEKDRRFTNGWALGGYCGYSLEDLFAIFEGSETAELNDLRPIRRIVEDF